MNNEIQRLLAFIHKTHKTCGPTWDVPEHDKLTEKALSVIRENYMFFDYKKVLDVGCGRGRDMDIFKREKFQPEGISISNTEAALLREAGHIVHVCDQNFMPFPNETYDMVWSRHCLEHSIMPFYTLAEYNRILKYNGICYLEVPGAETPNKQECNPNHFSILGKTMLDELIGRAGFQPLAYYNWHFDHFLENGETLPSVDIWHSYILRKVPIITND